MLRALVILLALLNAGLYVWLQNGLVGLGGPGPDTDREPRRLAAQVRPELVKVVTPAALSKLQSQTSCLEAGPFAPADLPTVDALARSALPEGSWTLLTRERPGAWVLAIGPFRSPEAQQRKAEELKRLGVAFEELRAPADHLPGLGLGRYGRLDEAQEGLRRLTERRVRSAKVLQLSAAQTVHSLRIPKADASLQASAASLREQLLGHPFGPCEKP